MSPRILVGTAGGLWSLDGDNGAWVDALAGRAITALALDGADTWAVLDGAALWRGGAGGWVQQASIPPPPGTCVAPSLAGTLVGTEQAHLFRLADGALQRVEAFEKAEGRRTWYTPWGDPADIRSIAVAADGTVHVNVHVGGVLRSRDGGTTWTPTERPPCRPPRHKSKRRIP